MNETIPQAVKDILIDGKHNRHQGMTEFLLSFKVGEIKETTYKGNSIHATCTNKKSRAYGLSFRYCNYDNKRYAIRLK